MCEEAAKIDEGVSDWEAGLPSFSDLTPLSQSLIPANLASAFKISPEPARTALDVNRASQSTISSLLGGAQPPPDPDDGSDPRKSRRADENFADEQSMSGARALRRPRLVWTPQLHRRFVEVVAHLGLRNAVPKTIMQLMNVEGLTRENVASHLQKYRLYVRRMMPGSTAVNEGAAAPSEPQSPPNRSSSAGPVVNGSVCNGSSGNNRGGIAIPMPPQIMMMGLGYESTQSQQNHNHHHHLHHYQQQQYNSMLQHNSMYYGYPQHPVAQNNNNNKC